MLDTPIPGNPQALASLEAELGAEGVQRERPLKECQGMPVGLGKQQVLKRGRRERGQEMGAYPPCCAVSGLPLGVRVGNGVPFKVQEGHSGATFVTYHSLMIRGE